MTYEEMCIETLESINAIKFGHFKLTSGNHSDTYIQKDIIHHHPNAFLSICNIISGFAFDFDYDVITGPAIAGAVIARVIAFQRHVPFVYPEKVIDSDKINSFDNDTLLMTISNQDIPTKMIFRRGHDKLINGKKVLLIEDIISTGGSVEETIKAIESNNGTVAGVIVLWNRSDWCKRSIKSVINKPVEFWTPEGCPLCKDGVPLMDPKK